MRTTYIRIACIFLIPYKCSSVHNDFNASCELSIRQTNINQLLIEATDNHSTKQQHFQLLWMYGPHITDSLYHPEHNTICKCRDGRCALTSAQKYICHSCANAIRKRRLTFNVVLYTDERRRNRRCVELCITLSECILFIAYSFSIVYSFSIACVSYCQVTIVASGLHINRHMHSFEYIFCIVYHFLYCTFGKTVSV